MLDFEIPEQEIREKAAKNGIDRFCTGLAVIRDGKLLVVRRVPDDSWGGCYEIPGGGVDEGETLAEGAFRELQEETGLKATKIIAMHTAFDYKTRSNLNIRQVNFVVEVEPETAVRLEPTEHDDYMWITSDDVGNLQTSDEMRECISGICLAYLNA